MINSNLLRSKIGFAQVKVKGIWKLYWMGQLMLDGKECKSSLPNCLPIRQWVFPVRTVNGEKKISLCTYYNYEEGFDFRVENFSENLSRISSLELRALFFQIQEYMKIALTNNNYRRAA